ncbi:hypothetical protein GNP84_18835 [Aliivibrio fischeri]|uniref:hypothetical protein n=1 Tax=Aliivibrio fischeri TaxID=668 RepID=UPI0012D881C7|nr:hypothetical protein [Aliivibrio fischeri]MUK78939.1 hypothetical protein [Aliivibrio fischeri]
MDNLEWIGEFFSTHKLQVSKIFSAGGCRELWLQGQIFLHLEEEGLLTNATQHKFDLYLPERFVFEIKMLGGYFQSKVKDGLCADFNKLASKSLHEKKYVMLVLDNQIGTDTKLYDSLSKFEHDSGKRLVELFFGEFSVIVWDVL